MRYRGPSSSAHASSSWRAVHSAVGCSVTLKCTSRRRLWVSITSTNTTRKVAVGTVKKECSPRLRRRPPRPDHVLRHRRLRDSQAELQQLAVDPRRTPERIRAAHLPNQIPQVPPNRGPTPSASTLPCPVEPEPVLRQNLGRRQVVDLSALVRRECRLYDHPLAPRASTPPVPLRRPPPDPVAWAG